MVLKFCEIWKILWRYDMLHTMLNESNESLEINIKLNMEHFYISQDTKLKFKVWEVTFLN